MTDNVFGGTLNLAPSVYLSIYLSISAKQLYSATGKVKFT